MTKNVKRDAKILQFYLLNPKKGDLILNLTTFGTKISTKLAPN